MPKIIKIGHCFTKLFKNNSGTFLWTTVYIATMWCHSRA